MATRH